MTELGFDVEKEGNPALAVVRNREFWTKLAREVKVENLRVLKVFAKRFEMVKASSRPLSAPFLLRTYLRILKVKLARLGHEGRGILHYFSQIHHLVKMLTLCIGIWNSIGVYPRSCIFSKMLKLVCPLSHNSKSRSHPICSYIWISVFTLIYIFPF